MKLILLHICLGLTVILSSQSSNVNTLKSSFDKIRDNLEQITHDYIDKSLLMQDYPDELFMLESIFRPPQPTSQLKSSFVEFRKADLDYNRATNGLTITGGYLHNLQGIQQDDDGLFYLSRWQAGLNWDILKGGVLESKSKSKINNLQFTIDSLKMNETINEKMYASIYDYIIYLFNGLKIQLVQRHQHLLDKELEVAYQLYYQKYIHWEEVLSLMSKKAEVDISLRNFINYNQKVDLPFQVDATILKRLPLLMIDFEKLKLIGIDTTLHEQIAELEIEKSRLDNKWDFAPSFNTYVRYNQYDDPGALSPNRKFVSGGLQFRIPVASRKRSHNRLMDAREQWLHHEKKTQYFNIRNELLNHYYEYEYTHRQFVDYYHRKLLAINQIDRELSKKQMKDPGYSPLEIAKRLDDLYFIDQELLDIQQKMYLKLLKIFQRIPDADWKSILSPQQITDLFAPYHHSHKMRIKPTTFTRHSEEFVMAYLAKNNIQNIIVDQATYAEVNDERRGDFKWSIHLNAEEFIRDGKLLEEPTNPGSPLYVSFSPDHLDSYFDKKEYYHNAYIQLLKRLTSTHDVNVSFPLFLDNLFIQEVAKITKKITLKAEELSDPELLAKQILSIGLNEDIAVQIELRCTSFLDRFQMEEFIQMLKDQLTIKAVVIYDFEELITLEANTIQLYEKQRF